MPHYTSPNSNGFNTSECSFMYLLKPTCCDNVSRFLHCKNKLAGDSWILSEKRDISKIDLLFRNRGTICSSLAFLD